MSDTTLFAGAALAIATAALYAYVGLVVTRRRVQGAAKRALSGFGLWWIGLGLVTVTGGLESLLVLAGLTNLAIHVTITHATLIGLSAALGGLLYYLLYLYTGNERLLPWVGGFYGLFFMVATYYVTAANPAGVDVGTWSVSIQYAQPAEGPLLALLIGMLIVPVILAAIGYGSLYFRVQGRSQRYRVATVSTAFLVWFGSALLASVLGWNETVAWPLVSRVIALGATLAILFAFQPPKWVRGWLDVEPFTREGSPHSGPQRGSRA